MSYTGENKASSVSSSTLALLLTDIDELKLVGPKALTKDISSWMEISVFADIAPASEI